MEPYIFWIYPWDVVANDPPTYNPQFTFCKVYRESIEVFSELRQHQLSVNLSDISECFLFMLPVATGSPITFAWLEFPSDKLFRKERSEFNRLCFAAIDPLTNRDGDSETRHLVQVINELRSGNQPCISVNPYQRSLIAHRREDEFSEEKWIAENPPSMYTPLPDRSADLRAGFIPLLIISGIGIAFFLIIYLLQLIGVLT